MYDLFVIFITEIYNYEDNKCKLYRLALKIVSQLFQIFTLEVHVNEYECTF